MRTKLPSRIPYLPAVSAPQRKKLPNASATVSMGKIKSFLAVLSATSKHDQNCGMCALFKKITTFSKSLGKLYLLVALMGFWYQIRVFRSK